MTAFIDPLVACALFALATVALCAVRFTPLAFAEGSIRVRRAVKSPETAVHPRQPAMPQLLDTANQLERLFAVIADCEKLANRAARSHATARAELDQADYHLTVLVGADPLLQRISTRFAAQVVPAARRAEASAKAALRLAA